MTLDAGLHLDVPHAEYHADPAPEPSLSASMALLLCTRTPLHAWLKHPRLGNQRTRDDSDASDRGSIVHELLLGGGAGFVVVEARDWTTKDARAQRDAARAEGKVPVLAGMMERCTGVAEAIRTRHGVDLSQSQREATVIRQEGEIWLRHRMDARRPGLITDLKTCEDANASSSPTTMIRNGLDIQWAAYVEAEESLSPELAGRVEMRFVFVEMNPQIGPLIVEPDGSMQELGRRRWARAKSIWAQCMKTGEWPGYPMTVVKRAAPAWALGEEFDAAVDNAGPVPF